MQNISFLPPMEDLSLYHWSSDAERDAIAQDPTDSEPSLCRLGARAVLEFVYETPASSLGFVIAAIAARYIYAPLAAPFWGLATGMLAGRLFIRLLEACRCPCALSIKRHNLRLIRRFPKLQLIGAIFAVVLGIIYAPLGFTVGIGIGLIGGINVSVEQALRRQRLNAERRQREEREGPYHLMLAR